MSPSATRMTTADTTALTSVGIADLRPSVSIDADRLRRRFFRSLGSRAQFALKVACTVAIEQVAEQPAVEIGRPKKPIGDREGQIHIHFHHQPRVMVGGMVPSQRVHEWAVLDEPALVEMAAKMHELINQIHSRG